MEQSKLVSIVIAKLKVAYPYYFEKLSDEEFLGMIALYQEHFNNFNSSALLLAINKIIHNCKFMPTVAEIIETYRTVARSYFKDLIENQGKDLEDKDYLLSMVDWYLVKDENLPKEIIDQINELDRIKLSTEKKEALFYDNSRII